MAIGLFIDGTYLDKVYPRRIDYSAMRRLIEAELNDTVQEGYYFSAGGDSKDAQGLLGALATPPPDGPGLHVQIPSIRNKTLSWPEGRDRGAVLDPMRQPPLQFIGVTQEAVDLSLVFHLTRSFSIRGWTKLVFAGGDGGFCECIQSLVKNRNVELYLLGTQGSVSEGLRSYARAILEVDTEPILSAVEWRPPAS